MTQFDMFGTDLLRVAARRALAPEPTYPPAVELKPVLLKLRVEPALDAWMHLTQWIRIIGHARDLTRLRAASDFHRIHYIVPNALYMLLKLSGVQR